MTQFLLAFLAELNDPTYTPFHVTTEPGYQVTTLCVLPAGQPVMQGKNGLMSNYTGMYSQEYACEKPGVAICRSSTGACATCTPFCRPKAPWTSRSTPWRARRAPTPTPCSGTSRRCMAPRCSTSCANRACSAPARLLGGPGGAGCGLQQRREFRHGLPQAFWHAAQAGAWEGLNRRAANRAAANIFVARANTGARGAWNHRPTQLATRLPAGFHCRSPHRAPMRPMG